MFFNWGKVLTPGGLFDFYDRVDHDLTGDFLRPPNVLTKFSKGAKFTVQIFGRLGYISCLFKFETSNDYF